MADLSLIAVFCQYVVTEDCKLMDGGHFECKSFCVLPRCFQVFKVIHQLVDTEEDILMVRENLFPFTLFGWVHFKE